MARPKLQKNTKTAPLVVHLPVPFKNRVLAAARKSEKPISQWVRETLTKHVPSSAPTPPPKRAKAKVKKPILKVTAQAPRATLKATAKKKITKAVAKPASKPAVKARVRKPYVKPSVVTIGPIDADVIPRATPAPLDLGDETAA